jgi:hypothetical protein
METSLVMRLISLLHLLVARVRRDHGGWAGEFFVYQLVSSPMCTCRLMAPLRLVFNSRRTTMIAFRVTSVTRHKTA